MALSLGSAPNSNISLGSASGGNLSLGSNYGAQPTASVPVYQAPNGGYQGTSNNIQNTTDGGALNQSGTNATGGGTGTGIDPAAQAAAAARAAQLAQAAKLRGDVGNVVSQIQQLYNQRYGQVDSLANEQEGKLNDRYGAESQDLTNQIADQDAQVGAAHSAAGTYDSSYRGNNVDTVTRGGQAQIRTLGQELQDNVSKIAQWVDSQKSGFTAQKGLYDQVLAHLAEETDPNNLTSLRNTITQKLADLQGQSGDYNTAGAQGAALETVAPSSARAQQLQVTLKNVLSSAADPGQKHAIGQALIVNSGLTPQDQEKLQQAFTSDLSAKPQVDQNGQPLTA